MSNAAARIIRALCENDGMNRLSDEQIENIAGRAMEEASDDLRRLAVVIEGIGCLVSADAQHNPCAGIFKNADSVADLMFLLSSMVGACGEAVDAADQAGFFQRERNGLLPEAKGRG